MAGGDLHIIAAKVEEDDRQQTRQLPSDGQSITATLEEGDRTLPNNSYFHLEMLSQQIDSTLFLLLPSREKLVAQNDDISPENFNARVRVTLPENGIYYLLVGTFEAGESGTYQLRSSVR